MLEDPKTLYPQSKEFHYRKEAPDKFVARFKVDKVKMHENHEELKSPNSGFDISVGILSGPLNKITMAENCKLSSIDEENVKIGDKIIVAGYPYKYSGYLYYMEGTIHEIKTTDWGSKLIFNLFLAFVVHGF